MASNTLIAVIDDDDSVRSALVALARSAGYAVQGFASGEDFFASENEQEFACVVTDIQMPGMSGIELKTQLLKSQCHVPVIMITARLEAGLREQALANGAACFLQKPFDGSTLLQCIENVTIR